MRHFQLRRCSLIVLMAGVIPTLTGFTQTFTHDDPTERDVGAYINKRYDYKYDVIDTVTAEAIVDVTHKSYSLTLPYKNSFNKDLPELLQMLRKEHQAVKRIIVKRLKWNSVSQGSWTLSNGDKDSLTVTSKSFGQDFVVLYNKAPIYASGKWKSRGQELYNAFRSGGYSFLAR